MLDLVAIGTVADMMPLLGEKTRSGAARAGTPVECARPGISALLAQAGMQQGNVDASMIGFRLGPRINAAGRISSAMTAYKLLRTNDPVEARTLAAELESLNQKRQEMVIKAQIEAEAQIAALRANAPLLLVRSPIFVPGIVGLVAGKLADRYYRPRSSSKKAPKKAARRRRAGVREFDISDALDEVAALLVRHGGHGRAAGFTVRTENLTAFAEALAGR